MSEGSDTRGGGHPFRPKPKERVKPPASAKELLERYRAGEREFAKTKLRGVSLRGADLSGVDLTGADFGPGKRFGFWKRRSDLRGVNLKGASLRGVNLEGARLEEADLLRPISRARTQ